ncbi:hypothetical protein CBR_g31791 [Chara braunii]|uniref:Uncharacterized protein n=1 Tax=Chara braunii TaxID=69332 RepID=A0A388LFM6_CHABU|nr:hypothetical protein CBR_g31791 [Chara braunii]|eukprot:GBG81115.1 hypothetical protein CBR_g31791 [Chara braunii]
MAAHGQGRSAGGSSPLREQHRRGHPGGQEPRGAQRLWCDYTKRIWYVDWVCQHASEPLKPPCGPVLFLDGGNMIRLLGSVVNWTEAGSDIFRFTLRKLYRSDGSVDQAGVGCNVSGTMFGGYGQRAMALPFFAPYAPGHDETVHVKDFFEVCSRTIRPEDVIDVDPGTSFSGPVGFPRSDPDGGESVLSITPPDPPQGMSDDSEDEHACAPVKSGVQGSRRQGLLGESAVSTSVGGSVRERLERASGARVMVGSAGARGRGDNTGDTPPAIACRDRAGAIPTVRKRVGGGEDTPKESSTRRKTGESSGKRLQSAKDKRADEGDTGEGAEDVELNLNAFNIEKAFFLEMKTGVQKDVVLHIHPERVLHIPEWEDAYNHRSLDDFLVDTIAAAMVDCYNRQDMRYTKPTFVLAPIVAPPEQGKPVVRVLPQDFDATHPEKYWYYHVCGQHNARAAMKVIDHPVFNYYTFYEWPFRPIYFTDEEFDGYAHVSCEDNLKDKKNPPRLQSLCMRDIRNIWKIRGQPRVVLGNVSKKQEEKFYEEWSKGKLLASNGRRWTEKRPTHEAVAKPGLSTITDSQGLKKHVWYVRVEDPSLRKGKGKAKKGGEEKTYYVQVPEPDVHCWKELADLTDREKRRLLKDVLNVNIVWVQGSNKKLAKQGKFSVKEMVDRIMLRLWHYVEFEYEDMPKEQWNVRSSFFRSKRKLFEEYADKGLDDKLWNESRKFFTDNAYVNKCPQFF